MKHIVIGRCYLKSCYDYYIDSTCNAADETGVVQPRSIDTLTATETHYTNESLELEKIHPSFQQSALCKFPSTDSSISMTPSFILSSLFSGKYLEKADDAETGLKCIVIRNTQQTKWESLNILSTSVGDASSVMKSGDILISVNDRTIIYDDIEDVAEYIRLLKVLNKQPLKLRFLDSTICPLYLFIDKMSLHHFSHRDMYGFFQSTKFIRQEQEISCKTRSLRSSRDLDWIRYLKVSCYDLLESNYLISFSNIENFRACTYEAESFEFTKH